MQLRGAFGKHSLYMVTAQSALFVAGVVVGLSSAYAQMAQRTTASYDDWTVSCTTVGSNAGGKSCEVFSIQTIENQPVSQITVKRAAKSEPYRVFIQVPTNVWLQSGVKLIPTDKEASIIATFRWCAAARCLADADLTIGIVNKMRTWGEPARLEYKDAAQQDVSRPISFKGFAPAFDALQNQ
jgi:invasion protein IalB